MIRVVLAFATALALLAAAPPAPAGGADAGRDLPRKVRGYKVEREKVILAGGAGDESSLVTFDGARVVSVGPLEVVLDVFVTVAPVEQGGRVERLVFEGVSVNGVPAEVDDYVSGFQLSKRAPVSLPAPLRVRVSSGGALRGVVSEILDRREVWPVEGRVYVCGRYRRFLMSFKRAVPVELRTTIANPL
ncbi:MAG TPA: hypothetical protein VEY09_17395 [Pyrinomonadaceae bacterium]|nr:hypothetical protein [Pyrinomonadaceae bacterium]